MTLQLQQQLLLLAHLQDHTRLFATLGDMYVACTLCRGVRARTAAPQTGLKYSLDLLSGKARCDHPPVCSKAHVPRKCVLPIATPNSGGLDTTVTQLITR
jgi:hypothetical protein